MIIAREYNPFTGMEITYERDPMNPRLMHIRQRQRQDETIELATRLRNDGGVKGAHGRLAGFVTPGLCLQWMEEHGVNPLRLPGRERIDFFKRKLNDRDYYKLRVTEGSL